MNHDRSLSKPHSLATKDGFGTVPSAPIVRTSSLHAAIITLAFGSFTVNKSSDSTTATIVAPSAWPSMTTRRPDRTGPRKTIARTNHAENAAKAIRGQDSKTKLRGDSSTPDRNNGQSLGRITRLRGKPRISRDLHQHHQQYQHPRPLGHW